MAGIARIADCLAWCFVAGWLVSNELVFLLLRGVRCPAILQAFKGLSSSNIKFGKYENLKILVFGTATCIVF
jgi:hypothetical protein